jgi:hypothetical protein
MWWLWLERESLAVNVRLDWLGSRLLLLPQTGQRHGCQTERASLAKATPRKWLI